MTPKQLQGFIDAPRALAAFLEGRGQLTHADQPVAAKLKPQPSTKTIIKDAEKATGRPATRVTRAPDGKVTVEFDKPADDGEARDASVVAMERIAKLRRVK